MSSIIGWLFLNKTNEGTFCYNVLIHRRLVMKYGYVRVSSQTQNIARQMEEMYKLGLTDNVILIDKQSGKDFERTN